MFITKPEIIKIVAILAIAAILLVYSSTNSSDAQSFATETTTRSVDENAGRNTDIGPRVSVEDTEGRNIRYVLRGKDENYFTINNYTGQLRTWKPLNYESKSSYEVIVKVQEERLVPILFGYPELIYIDLDSITVTINVNNVFEGVADENLRDAIKRTLGVEGNLTQENVLDLINLSASESEISNLQDLEFATNLEKLILWGNHIEHSDLKHLSDLTSLTDLRLGVNDISDISVLEHLTNLTDLRLNGNEIVDINVIANFTRLTNLRLNHNEIVDITPLSNLMNLVSLTIQGNEGITDYSVLNTLPNLTDVDIDISGIGTDKNDTDGQSAPLFVDVATLKSLTPAALQAWLEILHAKSDGSLKYLQAIALLESILAEIQPRKTALLANYPNPFNPETWIPYHLANPSNVEVSIYDACGVIIRHLELGHQVPGYYTSRNRAVYWDGTNDIGERVASGIYFYQLRADNQSLLRKMLILK